MDTLAGDLASMGIPADARQAFDAVDTGPPRLHLFEGHVKSFETYQACQWRMLPIFDGQAMRWHYTGIDATEIESTARLLGIKTHLRARVFRHVRIMAAAAAPVLNRVAK